MFIYRVWWCGWFSQVMNVFIRCVLWLLFWCVVRMQNCFSLMLFLYVLVCGRVLVLVVRQLIMVLVFISNQIVLCGLDSLVCCGLLLQCVCRKLCSFCGGQELFQVLLQVVIVMVDRVLILVRVVWWICNDMGVFVMECGVVQLVLVVVGVGYCL